MKFQIGDVVERIDCPYGKIQVGYQATITGLDEINALLLDIDGGEYHYSSKYFKLIKRGTFVSKREQFRRRIDKAEGWTKDIDDLLLELDMDYDIIIPTGSNKVNGGAIGIVKGVLGDGGRVSYEKTFVFNNQCDKNGAFKKALYWLVDHSKYKNDKQEKWEVMQKQMDELHEKMDELKEDIDNES